MLKLHIVVTMGWIGAVATFIVLAVTTAASKDVLVVRSAYVGMGLMTPWIIMPLALGSLVTGFVISLGTSWGLFRHWWVVLSLALTLLAPVVLLVQTPTVLDRAAMARAATIRDDAILDSGSMLFHSIGGLVVLLVITVLNVFKPRGLTRYGWAKQREAESREPVHEIPPS